jgi:hypothetical protein
MPKGEALEIALEIRLANPGWDVWCKGSRHTIVACNSRRVANRLLQRECSGGFALAVTQSAMRLGQLGWRGERIVKHADRRAKLQLSSTAAQPQYVKFLDTLDRRQVWGPPASLAPAGSGRAIAKKRSRPGRVWSPSNVDRGVA